MDTTRQTRAGPALTVAGTTSAAGDAGAPSSRGSGRPPARHELRGIEPRHLANRAGQQADASSGDEPGRTHDLARDELITVIKHFIDRIGAKQALSREAADAFKRDGGHLQRIGH